MQCRDVAAGLAEHELGSRLRSVRAGTRWPTGTMWIVEPATDELSISTFSVDRRPSTDTAAAWVSEFVEAILMNVRGKAPASPPSPVQ